MNRIIASSLNGIPYAALMEAGELIELIPLDEGIEGNIYLGRVKDILPGMNCAFIDIGREKNGYLNYGKEKPKGGEELLLMADSKERGEKGASLSKKLAFTGRYSVLLYNDENIGISKKITSPEERERLLSIFKNALPKNFGAIIRTEAQNTREKTISEEISQLLQKFREIQEKSKYTPPPALLYSPNRGIKQITGVFNDTINQFITDDPEYFSALKETFGDDPRITLYSGEYPLFYEYFVISQIKRMQNPKVWLKSGGYLIIEKTEALIAIDVNTGKGSGFSGKNKDATLAKINTEAVIESAKQIRLRNLTGIIIIDLAGSPQGRQKAKLFNIMSQALSKDRKKANVISITELGLMQITRKKD